MKLIVGLGNPGKEYILTRHNAGFLAVEDMLKKFTLPQFTINKKINGEISKGKINKTVSILLKPLTFMNNSGESVEAAMNFYKLAPSDIILIHDDKDIPLGETKVQRDRGAAGHNGVLSVIEKLGTKDFHRIRIGIAPQEKILSTSNFVLNEFSKQELSQLNKVFDTVSAEVISLL